MIVVCSALPEVAAEILIECREDPWRDDVVVGAHAMLSWWNTCRHFADFVDHRRLLNYVQQVCA